MNFLDLIFPKRCLGCGKFGKYFCALCISKIQTIDQHETICPVCERGAMDGRTHLGCTTRLSLDGLTSFFHYDGIVRSAIKTIKYRRFFDVAHEFMNLVPIESQIDHLITLNKNVVIVPIPLHKTRFRERGFNQAEIMGGILAQQLHVLMQKDFLVRFKQTIPQVKMKKREERLANMKGVFGVEKFPFEQKLVRKLPKSIILFDDVFTTGATMRSAATVLKRNGVSFVWAVTIAR